MVLARRFEHSFDTAVGNASDPQREAPAAARTANHLHLVQPAPSMERASGSADVMVRPNPFAPFEVAGAGDGLVANLHGAGNSGYGPGEPKGTALVLEPSTLSAAAVR